MEVLCNTENCEYWKPCEPKHLLYGRTKSLTIYKGLCSQVLLVLNSRELEVESVKYYFPYCCGYIKKMSNNDNKTLADYKPNETTVRCNANCLWNEKDFCKRGSIGIISRDFKENRFLVCQGLSNIKISGHFDWSRFPQGGHIGDRESELDKRENSKPKSFRTHFRREKEIKEVRKRNA